ncbi:MAG: UDP-N-acetylmuramoylalanyl-D-glutamyl-2,6-diaminopimelate--D-alanyl-D-alanine ligase [Alphaproteobacteria bacterium]|nr:UDP-N-acetylmuramoylalanyl-D-glutamyl-2,6-diaminopimelate--D-alanyl-D-alanine ligase [Alphaproteobacteria bacterium]
MSPLWTLRQIAEATGAAVTQDGAVRSVSIDTRTLEPGALFVALKDVRDGHDFVGAALARGAAAALVSRDVAGVDAGRLIKVGEPLKALEALARVRRAQIEGRVVAVTGSVGKTSTKEALRHLLTLQGRTHASALSYNNLWGVPLSLARMPRETQYGVFEIGMNHAGEITPLTAQVRPHVAIVTTVAAVHLEHFDSVAGIADAKGEIFSGLEPGGVAIINGDIEWTERLKAHAAKARPSRVVTFGRSAACDVRLTALDLGEETSEVSVSLFGKPIHYRIGAPGEHWVFNSLSVLAAISALGGDAVRAAADMASLSALAGRGARQRVAAPRGAFELIDESYNANPLSMAAAIANLARTTPGAGGRRIAVLGDMLELGSTGPELHAGLAQVLAEHNIDVTFVSGPLMHHLWSAIAERQRGGYAGLSSEIAVAVAGAVRAGDVVMVKGSYGSKMSVVVEALRRLANTEQ